MAATARLGLTPRQRAVYAYVRARIEEDGPPTIREIAEALGIGVYNAHCRLQRVIERGWLVRLPNKSRALALAENAAFFAAPGFEVGLVRPDGATAQAAQYRLCLPIPFAFELVDYSRARGLPLDEVMITALRNHVRGAGMAARP